MLSDKQVKALKATGKDVMRADGGGLYVRVSVHGTKTFVYRKRENGVARYLTLGEYPHIGLAEARTKVSLLQGKAIGIVTVQEAVDAYLGHIEGEYEHPEQVRRRLESDIVPVLGNRRLDSVTTKDLSDALQMIVDRGSPVAANRTLADVKHVFNFAYEKGWVRENPTNRITRKVVGGKEKTRDIVLTDDEIRLLLKELKSDRWEKKTRAGLALCLLTGQRASECLGMKGEVRGAWWTIPKSRTKSKLSDHKIYLVPLARYVGRHVEQCDHRTLSRALNRAKMRYTPHDLRRTMATKLSDLGVAPHVIEKMLHHQMEGVMAIYNRAEYLPEKKEAWQLWYTHLKKLYTDPALAN